MNYQNTLTDGTDNPITEQTTQYMYNFAITELGLSGEFAQIFANKISGIFIHGHVNGSKKEQSTVIYYSETNLNAYFKIQIDRLYINNINFKLLKRYDNMPDWYYEIQDYKKKINIGKEYNLEDIKYLN